VIGVAGMAEGAPGIPAPAIFSITAADGLVWGAASDGLDGTITRADANGRSTQAIGFKVVPQFVGTKLLLIVPEGTLINGLPALPVSIVQPRDLLAFPGGSLQYVTERITPLFGTPTPDMVGTKCPLCRTAIESDSWVLSCRCGAVIHYETAETMPDKDPDQRWDCGASLKKCHACGQLLSRESYLIWHPDDL